MVSIPGRRGGIDLTRENIKVNEEGAGVEMNINPAMIARFKQEGINSLSPVVFKITPIASIWTLVGLKEPAV